MPGPLEAEFTNFLSAYPGAESIDELLPGDSAHGKRRADFLLENRQIVLELKTLRTDSSPKVEREMEKHRDRPDFPLIYGEIELTKVLKHLPDGDAINRKIFWNVTRSVEDAVKSAEIQISNTREIFTLPDSVGLLAILNESVDILNPRTVMHRVVQVLQRDRQHGETRSSIDFVWYLSGRHVTICSDGVQALPSVLLTGTRVNELPWFEPLFAQLQERWVLRTTIDVREPEAPWSDLEFKTPVFKEEPKPTRITRQQSWEREYDANPYLRSLSDTEVLEQGAEAMRKFGRLVTKGAKPIDMPDMEAILREVTGFLQEARFRGLDLRRLPRP